MNYNCLYSQVMDVIVIGCGASGVAALRKLHDAGLKVMGLEAADRVGGRILTTSFGDSVVDIGAAWCHGEKDNIVFEIANPLDLLGRPEPDNKWYVLSNGELVEEGVAQSILTAIDTAVALADKNNSMSISEFVRSAANTNEVLKSDPLLTNYFIEWYERNNHLGGQSDPRKGKSLRGLEECWPCDGEFMLNWKGKGYATILDVLLNKHPDMSKELPITILKQKEVECIRWRANQPEFKTDNPLVHVKCKDGSLYAARSVIVTVSIGVMKERHEHLFQPPLPTEKVNAINTLQLCVLDKIYIEFQEPWWPKTPANFTILWRQEDKQQFSKDERWVTEIFGLNTVEYQPNVLLAWIYGNGAEEMEKASKDNVRSGVEKLLTVMFNSFNVTPIKNIVRSKWSLNPLARGAYAYRSVLTEQDGGSAAILGEPLYHADGMPIVCFAGEATSLHRHSAVHGAIEAGYREADRLINSFKKANK